MVTLMTVVLMMTNNEHDKAIVIILLNGTVLFNFITFNNWTSLSEIQASQRRMEKKKKREEMGEM